MISRRSIRIKVLQAIYGQFLLNEENVEKAYEIYDKSIQDVIEINVIYLNYLFQTFKYIEEYSVQQSQMYLLTDEEKKVNTSLVDAQLYVYLKENVAFHKLIKKFKLDQYIQSEYIKKMFTELIGTHEYKEFVLARNSQTEYNLCNSFFKKILFKNEDLIDYLESYYANIEEDADLVHFTLKRSIKAIIDKTALEISFGIQETKELKEFAYNLIKVTLEQQLEYMKLIKPKLKGWEAERIPILDMTIIKMAISEMLHFPTIPLKVSVNEYIDLTKLFCSVKSKDFVNGIMDRIMRELQTEGKILKTGRGLD
ncbi:MAG: transcription antitermination protein NusB [Chitinophagales bacterium]|jgi:N utilization substance protein B|nr:transcription antitermination protein NusB [Sphingobacteriales bacterium]